MPPYWSHLFTEYKNYFHNKTSNTDTRQYSPVKQNVKSHRFKSTKSCLQTMCVFRFCFCLLLYGHIGHWNCGPLPHSCRRCWYQLLLCLYWRPHLSHSYIFVCTLYADRTTKRTRYRLVSVLKKINFITTFTVLY